MSIIATILFAVSFSAIAAVIAAYITHRKGYEPLMEARSAYERECDRNRNILNGLNVRYIGYPIWGEGKVILAKLHPSFCHKDNCVCVVYCTRDEHQFLVFTDEHGEEIPKTAITYWMDITPFSRL